MADRRPLRSLFVAGCVAVAAGLGVAIWYDAHSHLRAESEASTLTAAQHHLADLRHSVRVTRYAGAVTANKRNELEATIGETLQQLSGVDSSLSSANASSALEGLGISTVHTCLGGVQTALNEVSGGDNAAAAKDISAVSGPCAQLDGGAAAGLVYPFDFPDPDVILVGQTYFAYATNSVAGNIQIIASDNLTQWEAIGNALPSLPSWAKPDDTWAPSVTRVKGAFLMYYAVDVASTGTECISVATARSPQGPFVDTSTAPLECQQSLGGSIDPSAFTDANGTPYLVWKSGGPGSSKLWSQQLNPSGTGFATGTNPVLLLSPDQSWEGGTVEAPDLVLANGHYVLVLLGERLEQRQLRSRRGDVRRAARSVRGRFARSDPGLRDRHRRPGRGIGVHRHERRVLDRVPRVGSRCGGLPQQPRPLRAPAGPLGRGAVGRRSRARLTRARES